MKSDLRRWLLCADFRSVLNAVTDSSRTISVLITLTYSEDPVVSWRAVDAVGRSAEMHSTGRPDAFRNYLRRLFWMMRDESGAIAPHAPEVIGEIIRSNPKAFSDFIPMTVSLLGLEPEDRPRFLPGILYALGRIGEAAPDAIREGMDEVEEALSAPDPQARAEAIRCFGRIGLPGALIRHPELARDAAKALIYHEENMRSITVGALYEEERNRFPPGSRQS